MFIKKIACSSADADATLVGRDETSADAEGSIFPLPPAAEAVEDTDAPTDALAAALQVPEVSARIAAAASVLLVGGAATAAGLAASDADPMAASAPLEIVVMWAPTYWRIPSDGILASTSNASYGKGATAST